MIKKKKKSILTLDFWKDKEGELNFTYIIGGNLTDCSFTNANLPHFGKEFARNFALDHNDKLIFYYFCEAYMSEFKKRLEERIQEGIEEAGA